MRHESAIVLIWTAIYVEASNILAVLPVSSKSHHYMFEPVIRRLAKHGHKITLITPYPLGGNVTNIEEIIVHTSGQNFLADLPFEEFIRLGDSPIFVPPRMSFWFFGKMISEDCLNNPNVQKLIHSKDRTYDLILLEIFFGQESFMGFSERFKAPVVSIVTQVNFLFNDIFVGNPLALSYVPHLELPYTDTMGFFERLINAVRSFIVLFVGYNNYLPEQEVIMKKYFNYTDPDKLPHLVDMLKNNISLTVVNSQIGLDYVRPLMPNVIDGAGLHITHNPDPLPTDIQEFMDSSTEGVIYFSLGTILPVHRMPSHIKDALVKAFSKLKQNVLWKANVDSMKGIPHNVKVIKWAPQQSVLAHPKIKAFITHGGLLSHQEAVYFGVPLIGMPVFCDQHMNVARAVKFGFGLKLTFNYLTEDVIFQAINEIVNNKKYGEAAKQYSKIVRDNPMPRIENVIYWIEYVLRYKGATHLRNTVQQNLNYFQYLLLDIILFIFVILSLSFYITYYITRFLVKKYFNSNCIKQNVKYRIE